MNKARIRELFDSILSELHTVKRVFARELCKRGEISVDTCAAVESFARVDYENCMAELERALEE